ncbi:hypothetical protein AVEN_4566-1 [Araneus ventricosus]|uniref:Glycosyltransferase family 92 protein n=1 Tax=Araneus ventricosus TaxID=182803 RepID=A0A4Y2BLC1_ARAVE|nr:hypothetical protein AVEN_4566-1 [Araneus ventricosus]
MKILTPRHSFSLDYTPKQWVGFSNTFLLLLVAAMCGTVIYEVYNINQRFTTMLDSSVATIDLLATSVASSKIQPFWKEINNNISVYSSFFKMNDDDESMVLIIGSISNGEMHVEDLRCLIKYNGEEDINVVEASFEKFSNCSAFLVYCPTKGNKIPSKVVLISYSDTNPKRWIEVEKISSSKESHLIKPKTAACVQPLTENISVETIQEFIEFYETIGLSHFYLYDFFAPEDVVDFIRELIDNGHSINILPWNKNVKPLNSCPFSGHEYIQDCLHRALDKFNNVLTVDATDYFILGQYSSIDELLENYSDYGELQIKKALHCDTSNQNLADLSLKNMHFVGPIEPSRTNYFFRPEEKSAVEFYTSSSRKALKSTEILSEREGIVGKLSNECERDFNI